MTLKPIKLRSNVKFPDLKTLNSDPSSLEETQKESQVSICSINTKPISRCSPSLMVQNIHEFIT